MTEAVHVYIGGETNTDGKNWHYSDDNSSMSYFNWVDGQRPNITPKKSILERHIHIIGNGREDSEQIHIYFFVKRNFNIYTYMYHELNHIYFLVKQNFNIYSYHE